jgi:hypothetical protein
VHWVTSEARLSAINGVLPMAPTIPSLVFMSRARMSRERPNLDDDFCSDKRSARPCLLFCP